MKVVLGMNAIAAAAAMLLLYGGSPWAAVHGQQQQHCLQQSYYSDAADCLGEAAVVYEPVGASFKDSCGTFIVCLCVGWMDGWIDIWMDARWWLVLLLALTIAFGCVPNNE
jgi:hypothetical protein